MAITKPGTYQDFNASANQQSFTIPFSGLYKLEVWGAQGGTNYCWNYVGAVQETGYGGKGGYAMGHVILKKGTTLYLYVGTKGVDAVFNDSGGLGKRRAGGGKATHIAYSPGTLQALGNTSKILCIAGGGGGAGGIVWGANPGNVWTPSGGAGGGQNGGGGVTNRGSNDNFQPPQGGTQTAGGLGEKYDGIQNFGCTSGSFGKGGNADFSYSGYGGDGLYGGGGAFQSSSGAGGSGFIGNLPPSIIVSGITYGRTWSNGARSGDGLARITLVRKSVPTMYLGTLPVDALMLGSTEISDMALGNKML